MNPINPKEIALKLYSKRPHWFSGIPTVEIDGEEKSFGFIKLIFPKKGAIQDPPVFLRAYIYNKAKLQEDAQYALDNFVELINEAYKDFCQ